MEFILVCIIAFTSFLNLLVSLGIGEQILKPFSMYVTSRGMDKLHPHYERIRAGFEALDNTLMQDNHLVDFLFEATDYVWAQVIPAVAKDLPEDQQVEIANYLIDKFDGDALIQKIAKSKEVVSKQIPG